MPISLDNPKDLMLRAHALAQRGELKGAAEICRAILARAPAHFYALFMLGNIEAQSGHLNNAAKLLSEAARLDPRSADALASYGNVLLEQSRHEEAIEALTNALALQPRHGNALIYRGLAFVQSGRREEAVKDFERALRLDPNSVFAHHNKANVLIQMNRHAEARRNVDTVLRLDPRHLPAMINRALILIADEKTEEALIALDQALKLDPNNADAWNTRGWALYTLKQFGRAFESYAKAAALNPKLAEACLGCANSLMEQERLEDALIWCGKAIAAKFDYAPAHLLRANILMHLGRRTEAFASYDASVAAAPDYAEGYYHRGSALLLDGQFGKGFADFEHRWNALDCGFDRPNLLAPEWKGEPLSGKSIVVYSEQGLGDTIQFARFLPLIAQTGAKLTFLCHPNLVRLFALSGPKMELIASCPPDRPFDFQCALMSLPYRLGSEIGTVPNVLPYVFAQSARTAQWREKIGSDGFKIGIGWQGNPKGQIDKGRSTPLERFAPLSAIEGVRLISLQKTHGLDQLARLPSTMRVETLGEFDMGEDAFLDTAAILQNLDLVITSDTALPHLAGAMNIPCWVALKHMPDWRWMLGRSDSPWYPSLRLFRQTKPGDWDGVFAEIARDLRRRMGMDV